MYHQHIASRNGDTALSSMSSITRLAITTDTGYPIAVPCICWYTFPQKDRKVASKQSDSRSVMSFTLRLERHHSPAPGEQPGAQGLLECR